MCCYYQSHHIVSTVFPMEKMPIIISAPLCIDKVGAEFFRLFAYVNIMVVLCSNMLDKLMYYYLLGFGLLDFAVLSAS